MTGLFWNHRTIAQSMDAIANSIEDASVPSPDAARGPAESDAQERLDQLLLVGAAMWELLSEKAGLTEADLVARIAEIDARDGVADGKITAAPAQCPQCQRTIFAKQQRCLYCGAPRPVDSVFKNI